MKQKKISDYIYILPYLLLFVYFLVRFCFYKEFTDDDIYFSTKALENSGSDLIALLKYRYDHWSSRFVIETILFLIMKCHLNVWRVFMAGLFAGSAWCMNRLLGLEKNLKAAAAISIGLIMLPFSYIDNAGLVTTTMFYIMPIFLGLLAFMPVRLMAESKQVPLTMNILLLPCFLIACNMEQTCALLLGGYLCAFAYFTVTEKKIRPVFFYYFVLIGVSLLNQLTCPGNVSRNLKEIENWMPEFADWSVMTKLSQGVMHTLDTEFMLENGKYLIFLLQIVLLGVLLRKKKYPYAFLGLCSTGLFLVFNVAMPVLETAGIDAGMHFGNISQHLLLSKRDYLYSGLEILVCGLLLVQIFFCFENSRKGCVMSLVYLAGLCSGFMMGFSPTLYASRTRVFVCLHFCIAAIIAALVSECKRNQSEQWD